MISKSAHFLLFSLIILLTGTASAIETPKRIQDLLRGPFRSGFNANIACAENLVRDPFPHLEISAPAFKKLSVSEKIKLIHTYTHRLNKRIEANFMAGQKFQMPGEEEQNWLAARLRLVADESQSKLRDFRFELLAISFESSPLVALGSEMGVNVLTNFIKFHNVVASLPTTGPQDSFSSMLRVNLSANQILLYGAVLQYSKAFPGMLKLADALISAAQLDAPEVIPMISNAGIFGMLMAIENLPRVPPTDRPVYIKATEKLFEGTETLYTAFFQDPAKGEEHLMTSALANLQLIAELPDLERFPNIRKSIARLLQLVVSSNSQKPN